jgi:hypothetical protein
MSAPENLIEQYLDFFQGTEVPTIYDRWCCISGISTILGRNCWVTHGHSKIYPNQYIMLVGESGARKTTAIKRHLRPVLDKADYKSIAANKTSKEKFLADFELGMDKANDPEEMLDVTKDHTTKGRSYNPTMRQLFGLERSSEPSECLIMSDDFNVFLGHGNIEFIELLTDMWDYEGLYRQRIKSGRSVAINDPTLSCLLGNTQLGIAMSFPPEVIGQGFFSRLIQVYSDPTGIKITFPKPKPEAERQKLVEQFKVLRATYKGEIGIDGFGTIALNDIYQEWKDLEDVRFKSYSTRRFTHLLKLCLCCAAARSSRYIDRSIVEYANSILHYTEYFMPKALGEFGKAKHSDISAKIIETLEKAEEPVTFEKLLDNFSRDVDSGKHLAQILGGLKDAHKIQQIGGGGFLPHREPPKFDFPHCKVQLLREYIDKQTKEGLPI